MYVCQHCQKSVKHLKEHLKRCPKNPENAQKPPATPEQTVENPAADETPATFEVIKPPPASPKYHCVGCGGTVARGDDVCSKCGETLDWSGVK